MSLRGYFVERQQHLPVRYKEIEVACGFRVDLLIERKVIVEIKATKGDHPIHRAQTLNYVRLADLAVGLLLNFNVELLKNGIQRLVIVSRTSPRSLCAPLPLCGSTSC